MSKELERRYLAAELPSTLDVFDATTISDCYWPLDAAHSQLRLRANGSKYEITKKVPVTEGDLSIMREYTIPLTTAEYNALKTTPGKWVVKERLVLLAEGARIEIGIFSHALKGLVIIDVEFLGEDGLRDFVPPQWFGSEVTQDKRFAGGELCGKSLADIAGLLKEYNAAIFLGAE